jgi:hypothetical protein
MATPGQWAMVPATCYIGVSGVQAIGQSQCMYAAEAPCHRVSFSVGLTRSPCGVASKNR